MGYCRNQWISDYNFEAIFERIERVNGAAFFISTPPRPYRVRFRHRPP